ncbi:MAG: hypothetical protein IPM25_04580 [Chloracidobacterium sp.]|nr:hypothetical protein [Chloracidobacterium sp.]
MRNHTVPPDADAALYFLPGQYLFETFGETKARPEGFVRRTSDEGFSRLQTDTGWIDRKGLKVSRSY